MYFGLKELNMLLKSVRGYSPSYGEDCFFAENATLIGDIIMGSHCSVWYHAVIRVDVNSIKIGNEVIFLTSFKYSTLPIKKSSSVKIDKADAPKLS